MSTRAEDEVAKHDDGDIHKIVGDENGGQRAFAVLAEHFYFTVFCIVLDI